LYSLLTVILVSQLILPTFRVKFNYKQVRSFSTSVRRQDKDHEALVVQLNNEDEWSLGANIEKPEVSLGDGSGKNDDSYLISLC
jgi:hypothetical protein